MSKMRIIYSMVVLLLLANFTSEAQKYLERSGRASFFSEAPVENIKAVNDQVLAILNSENGEVAVSMLMKGFQFKKALMQEHFNDSYVESDKFPKANFKGKIKNFSPELLKSNGKLIVNGEITIHGVTKSLTTEVTLERIDSELDINGRFPVTLADFDIDIPKVVVNNIAEVIEITFDLKLKKQ